MVTSGVNPETIDKYRQVSIYVASVPGCRSGPEQSREKRQQKTYRRGRRRRWRRRRRRRRRRQQRQRRVLSQLLGDSCHHSRHTDVLHHSLVTSSIVTAYSHLQYLLYQFECEPPLHIVCGHTIFLKGHFNVNISNPPAARPKKLIEAQLLYNQLSHLDPRHFVIIECRHLANGCLLKCGCIGLMLFHNL